ncbi:MAG: S-layer homology domain-containing protein [Oscillospiraceae bacterium]|nr:S-layer homology domain-containing protein [Oscillospiraceae bacterium]
MNAERMIGLYEMQLFYGTDAGYDLDRAPSRAEASAMLVRLLGKEAEAQSGHYKSPFTDVPAWAKPYVGWLYQNKLTFGIGGNKFGSNDRCDARMMSAFLLRTLGYAEANGDFTYANALEFAEMKGVADAVNQGTTDFTRDEMVAMSYTALSRPTKAGASSLLAELVGEGAIDALRAQDTLRLFANHRVYEAWANASAAQARETETSTILRAGRESTQLYTLSAVDPIERTFSTQTWEGEHAVDASWYYNGILLTLQDGEKVWEETDFETALGEHLLPVSAVRDAVSFGGAVTLLGEPTAAARWKPELSGVEQLNLSVKGANGLLTEQNLTGSLAAGLEFEYHTVTTATGWDVWVQQPAILR